jgi:hypothetical protein
MSDRGCKRCSVTRVNALCEAYEKAHQDKDGKAMHDLRKVADLVNARGFDEVFQILKPGLANQHLRAFCWNVSSFLEDEDMKQIFGWLPRSGKE